MSEPKNQNQKTRVLVLAGLLFVVGFVAMPTASAATIGGASGGCSGNLVSDLKSNPTWENLFGDVGRFVDCVSFGTRA